MRITEFKALVENEMRSTLQRLAQEHGVTVEAEYRPIPPNKLMGPQPTYECSGEIAWKFDLLKKQAEFTVP